MFLKSLVEKRCAECKLRLKESVFEQHFSLFALSSDQDQDASICSCDKTGKTILVATPSMRVMQSITLLVISLVVTGVVIIIRDSPILNADSNSILEDYELSINDVNRLKNYLEYETYLSKQFSNDGFDLSQGRLNPNGSHSNGSHSNGFHSNISAHSRELSAGGSIE